MCNRGRYIAESQRQGVGDQLPFYAPYVLDQCGWVANRYAQSLPISGERQIELLQELDPVRRLEAVARLISGRIGRRECISNEPNSSQN